MQDDFKRFRYAVGDAIFDSCKVASSVAVIAKLSATLHQKLPEFAANPQQHWRTCLCGFNPPVVPPSRC